MMANKHWVWLRSGFGMRAEMARVVARSQMMWLDKLEAR
jgi:hypothetical protein